ncbi:MAG: hypothetical protein JSW67_09495 [Candidatus Latescibacterota bacterium]|nr:MAG: hypothetical protein JSW67_09495 [Candidatus Latescibacterota bacterium]
MLPRVAHTRPAPRSTGGAVLALLLLLFGVVAGATLAVVVASRAFGLMVEDDAFMFVRYAHNILEHGRIAWNPGGPPTYGPTSLFYLVVVVSVRALVGEASASVAVLSSLVCGLAFLMGVIALAWRAADCAGGRRLAAVACVLLALAWAADDVGAHCVTGMDTTFALAWATLLIHLGVGWERRAERGWSVALGIVGGMSLAARPELLLYPASIGLVAAPRRAARLLAVTAATAIIVAVAAWAYFGSPLPLSFYVKSIVRYEGAMDAAYRDVAARELAAFVRVYWLLLLPIAIRLLRDALRRRWSLTRFESACLIATLLYVSYHRFFVLPIMPHYQRFFYPTLPAIVLLAVRSAGSVAISIRLPVRLGVAAPIAATVTSIALAATLLPLWQRAVPRLRSSAPFFRIAAIDNHAGSGRRYWYRLEQVSALPEEVVLAATEIGLPGVLNLEKKIVDLSGLNDPHFARHGFDADRLFQNEPPDWIYMPHPDYVALTRAIRAHPVFRSEYDALRPGTTLPLAIRRTSPHYARMRAILRQAGRGATTPRGG